MKRRFLSVIASLRGPVASRQTDHIVIDVGGVGYRVFVPLPSIQSVGNGDELFVFVHTHVREDSLLLFGFITETEREVFRRLNTVSGIGPKLAMNILSGTTIEELIGAVAGGDVKGLKRIPGVGKKTAERILVELREIFAQMNIVGIERKGLRSAVSGVLSDVSSALGNLGFKSAQIERALDGLEAMESPPADFDELLREALRLIR